MYARSPRAWLGATLLFVALVASSGASAQSPNTAALTVVVLDQSGAVVPGATIHVENTETGFDRTVSTGPDGTATTTALSITGRYVVTVSKTGFADEHVTDLVLRAGETARLSVGLRASGGASEVTVYGTAGRVGTGAALGTRLDSERIEETPLLGRKASSLPLLDSSVRTAKGTGDLFLNSTLVVANAGGRRQTTTAIDGANGDDPWGRQAAFSTVPLGAIEEMTVLSNAFSAEYGWTASSAVNVVTRAGTNHVRGEALFLGRPGAWQDKTMSIDGTTITPADVPDALAQVSGSLGGPIVADRTHVFVSADGTWQDRTAIITSPLRTQDDYVGQYRQGLLDVRLDHQMRPAHHLMVRGNIDRFTDTNPNDTVSGTTLPSAAREFSRATYALQLNATSVLSPSLLNEARLAWQNGSPITYFAPVTPSTQFVRAGVATEGESRIADIFSRQLSVSDTLSWTRGRHFARLGGSLARAESGGNGQEFGSGFILGQYQVIPTVTAPVEALTLADVTRYTQSFGTSTYRADQWLYALFAQDDFRLRSDLTVSAGLRYDRQTFSDGTKNLAPRVGATWNPGGGSATAVRGGYGVYYSQLRSNLQASFALGGPEGVFTYSAAPGQPGFPTSITGVPIDLPPDAVIPARNITVRPGDAAYYSRFFDIGRLTNYPDALVNPKSRVTSIGVERQLGGNFVASADYVHQHWEGIDRTVDLNAPSPFERTAPGQVRSAAAADATRPIAPIPGGYRQIAAVVNEGLADYDGLQTRLVRRDAKSFLSVSYTLSKSTNTVEPDAPGGGPNDSNQLGEVERGPSSLDQRHRAVIAFSYQLPYGLSAGTISMFASARPYGATTGVDNNGDGATTDRPVIDGVVIGRNTFRGSSTSDVTLFIEERLPVSRGHFSLRAELFNAFNHANVLGRQSVYGNAATPGASFGQPAAGLANIDPPRMLQLQVRFQF